MDAAPWATHKWGGPDPKSAPQTNRMDALWGDHDPSTLLKPDPSKPFKVGLREIEVGTSTILRINSVSSRGLAQDSLIDEAKRFEESSKDAADICAKWESVVLSLKSRPDPRSPATAVALEYLARAQRCAGRFEEALDTHEDSVNMYESMMHFWAHELLRARCWFADILMCHGEVEDSRLVFSRVWVEWEQSFGEARNLFGPDRLGTLCHQCHYAMAMLDCGHYDGSATRNIQDALARLEKYLEKDRSQTYWEIYFIAMCINGCALALDRDRDALGATKFLSMGISQLQLLTGPSDYVVHRSKLTLMGLLVGSNEFQKASLLGRELLAWSRAWYGDSNPDTLADISASVKLHFENLKYYRYAASLQKFFIQISQKKWGENDARTLKAVETLHFMLPVCGFDENEIELLESNTEQSSERRPPKPTRRRLRNQTILGPAGKVRFIDKYALEEPLNSWTKEEQTMPPKDLPGFRFRQYTSNPNRAPSPAKPPNGLQAGNLVNFPSATSANSTPPQSSPGRVPSDNRHMPYSADSVGMNPAHGQPQAPPTPQTSYTTPSGSMPNAWMPPSPQQPQQPEKSRKRISKLFSKKK